MRKAAVSVFLIILIYAFVTLNTQDNSEVYEKVTKTFTVEQGGIVVVEADDGSIKVNTWDKNELEIVMHKRAWGRNKRDAQRHLEKIEIELSQKNKRFYIRDITDIDQQHRIGLLDLLRGDWKSGTNVDFEILMPEQMDLELSNDDGDIEINDLEGDISIDLDDGDVDMKNVRSDLVEINLDDGDIDLENLKQTGNSRNSILFIKGDDGDVFLRNCELETIEVESDDGNINFRDVTITNLDINLDDGDFDAGLAFGNSGRIRIELDDGDVVLRLPEEISAYFDLYASDGRIRTNFPLDILRDEDISLVKGQIGSGDVKIRIEVDNGLITVRHQ